MFFYADLKLDVDQTVPGFITEFNMWNYEMDSTEVNSIACGAEGNVVSWDSLEEVGISERSLKTFSKCGNYLWL